MTFTRGIMLWQNGNYALTDTPDLQITPGTLHIHVSKQCKAYQTDHYIPTYNTSTLPVKSSLTIHNKNYQTFSFINYQNYKAVCLLSYAKRIFIQRSSNSNQLLLDQHITLSNIHASLFTFSTLNRKVMDFTQPLTH